MSEDSKGRRQKEIQVFSKPNPNRAKSGPHPAKLGQNKAKENPWIPFAELSLIKTLRRPPGPFLSLRRFPPGRRPRASPARPVRHCVSLPWSSFRVRPCLFKRGEGLAPFHDRGRLGVVCPTRRPPPDEREKGTRARGLGPRGKRQADQSDVRQEFARKRARSGFEPLGIADGRQPFMPRVSHNPCLLMLPFCFAHARRMPPLSVGRLDNAFHPATGSPIARFGFSVKNLH
jgi:hypothetical protein